MTRYSEMIVDKSGGEHDVPVAKGGRRNRVKAARCFAARKNRGHLTEDCESKATQEDNGTSTTTVKVFTPSACLAVIDTTVRASSEDLSQPTFITPIGRLGVRIVRRPSQHAGRPSNVRLTMTLLSFSSQMHFLMEAI